MRYRKIDPRFWKDEKIVLLSPEEKLVALYLFTAQANRIGLFSFSPGEAAEDVGMLPETFAERFRKVVLTLHLEWDETFRVLFIPKWWKYNPPDNPNNVIGNLKDLDDLPNSHLIAKFAENLEYFPDPLRPTFTQTLARRYPDRYPKRSPTQEQEQEQDIEPVSARERRPTFSEFELTERMTQWCAENEIPLHVAEAELPKFKDYYVSKGRRLKDVAAGFRNWLRKAKEFQSPNGNQPGGFVG